MPSHLSIADGDQKFQATLRDLAAFRYTLRKFLRFSERAAREAGLTPQQHQLMLGIAGYSEHGSATVSELAEFLQERHNSVVGLIERAEQAGLVHRSRDSRDRRVVRVSLTSRGSRILTHLTSLHKHEVDRIRSGFLGALAPSEVHKPMVPAHCPTPKK